MGFAREVRAHPDPGRRGGGVPRRRPVGAARSPCCCCSCRGCAARSGRPGGSCWCSCWSSVPGSAAVLVIPDGKLPIPPGGGLLVTPSVRGRGGDAEADHPGGPPAPAAGGQRQQLDAQRRLGHRRLRGPGPAGHRPRGRLGVVRRQGVRHARLRLPGAGSSALCGSITGPVLHLIDPDSMEPIDSLELPGAPATRASGRGRTCAAARTSTSTTRTGRSSAPPAARSSSVDDRGPDGRAHDRPDRRRSPRTTAWSR